MKYTFKDYIFLTLKTDILFICLYGLTYFLAAFTFNIIFSVPYDRSNVSPFYYGLLFSIIPYFVIGYWIAKETRKSYAAKIFALINIMFLDKIVIVYLLGVFSGLLPIKEKGFFSNTYSYMCEELPFYCHPLAYFTLGTIVALLSFIIAIGLQNKRRKTTFSSTQN